MSNEQPHINPWAEKLQQVSMPDTDASWQGMERLLDQHLPVEEKEKKRRFFFILFPVFLLGIGLMLLGGYLFTASKPQVKQHQQAAESGGVSITAVDSSSSGDATLLQASGNSKAVTSAGSQLPGAFTINTVVGDSGVSTTQAEQHAADAIKEKHTANSKTSSFKASNSANNNYPINYSEVSLGEKTAAAAGGNSAFRKTTKADSQTQMANGNTGTGVKKNKEKANAQNGSDINGGGNDVAILTNKRKDRETNAVKVDRNKAVANLSATVQHNSPMRTHLLPVLRKPVNPLQQLILKDSIDQLRSSVLSDSVLQAMKNKGSELIKRGWTFSVGVNHFVRINSQQPAPYKGNETTPNSEGLTGKITDYLPVPQARYHFNNKLFIQGELQFNAPQFTQPVQLEHRNYSDGLFNVNDTAYLKKLTYFNLPLSIHYSPLKRFYIGAGIQYSRLNNAIVLHEKTKTRGGSQFPDSTFKSSKQERIKDDTLFQKLHTSELRLLSDVSYQAGAFGVGVRYNYALRNLVKVPVVGGTITQARNSSLQLYIRYQFLDKRKRKHRASK
ncbi:outer membrane beta-barrel protein [Flavisolibacter tropicus]|uniref:Outer membrane protein beta-barrel domain-containing protein n=1 Tax=Flavisolibacter tropicus TaxID=1492898 RepID=A0A172TY66_9BACT|nr:outer membrane beta-barrel protein [Flavisolibacter tropicus]ANE52025.1 hypothetical protein SY85_17505 [Flavisolibacter tropicus]